jgi:Ras family protein T1
MEMCDLMCYVYDSSDANSFEWVVSAFKVRNSAVVMKLILRLECIKKHNLNHIPCIFIATKSDLDLVQQVTLEK